MKDIAGLIFPDKGVCVFCGSERRVDMERGVCEQCERALPLYEGGCAELNGLRYAVPFAYAGGARSAVMNLKYNGAGWTAKYLAAYMTDAITKAALEFDAVAFVPITARKRRKRGYNQSELLARHVAEAFGRPLVACLKKTRETPTQTALSPEERARNVRGAFAAGERLRFERVLLIDDVLTTGATSLACAQALLEAGAKEVCTAVFARTPN